MPRTFRWPTAVACAALMTACGTQAPTPADPDPAPTDAAPTDADVPPAPDDAEVEMPPTDGPLRVATFNAALNRPNAGDLGTELAGDSAQARAVAEIIQRTAPDVLVLQEFDVDPAALDVFRSRYLAVAQGGADAIDYPHVYVAPSNTGEPTGLDVDGDGSTDGPADAHGFGRFPGQYGFAILSKHPIDTAGIRTFREFVWSAMPGARRPVDPESGADHYREAVWQVLRLSSKNHVDVPITVGGRTVHVLAAHPTPPVFDGPEDRNGRRNADEIRLFADYLDPAGGGYIVDDAGRQGGLAADALFVVAGDMNADPVDGDSTDDAILQLLDHPRIHRDAARGEKVPRSEGARLNSARPDDAGDKSHDTAGWGLRVDYVLPSAQWDVVATGVFWPGPDDPVAGLTDRVDDRDVSSDHRLVWVDLRWPGAADPD